MSAGCAPIIKSRASVDEPLFCNYINPARSWFRGFDRVEISYDPQKRAWTIEHRGLDFEDSAAVFTGPTANVDDDRQDYGERRTVTYGLLNARLVAVVWTPRGNGRHIISMRKCNAREREKFEPRLARAR